MMPGSEGDKLAPVDITGWTWNARSDHYTGDGWFADGFRCVQEPRLYRMVRYHRRGHSVTVEFQVDGLKVADLGAARLALASPPAISDEEWATMERFGVEFGPCPAGVDLVDVLHIVRKGWMLARPPHTFARRPDIGR